MQILACSIVRKGLIPAIDGFEVGLLRMWLEQLMRWCAHQKGNVVHLIKHFPGRVGRRLDFPCTHRIERGDQMRREYCGRP